MPGHYVSRTWAYDPIVDAPGKYRRACKSEAFIPVRLTELALTLEASTAGLISEAESAISSLNEVAHLALAPLAREFDLERVLCLYEHNSAEVSSLDAGLW